MKKIVIEKKIIRKCNQHFENEKNKIKIK